MSPVDLAIYEPVTSQVVTREVGHQQVVLEAILAPEDVDVPLEVAIFTHDEQVIAGRIVRLRSQRFAPYPGPSDGTDWLQDCLVIERTHGRSFFPEIVGRWSSLNPVPPGGWRECLWGSTIALCMRCHSTRHQATGHPYVGRLDADTLVWDRGVAPVHEPAEVARVIPTQPLEPEAVSPAEWEEG